MKSFFASLGMLVVVLGLLVPANAQDAPDNTAPYLYTNLLQEEEGFCARLQAANVLSFPGRILAVGFSTESSWIAVATDEKVSLIGTAALQEPMVWDDAASDAKIEFDRPPIPNKISFDSISKRLAYCGPKDLKVWQVDLSVTPPTSALSWQGASVYNAIFTPDGSKIACAVKEGPESHVDMRDAATGQILWKGPNTLSTYISLAFTPEGDTLRVLDASDRSSNGGDSAPPYSSEGHVNSFNTSDGVMVSSITLSDIDGPTSSLSVDAQRVASIMNRRSGARTGFKLAIFDATTGLSNDFFLDGVWNQAWTTVFSPDNRSLVALGRAMNLFDPQNMAFKGQINFLPPNWVRPGFLSSATPRPEGDGVGAFSPDGSLMAIVREPAVTYASSANRTVRQVGRRGELLIFARTN